MKVSCINNQASDIVHFHRKPFAGAHSIEGLFASIRGKLAEQGCPVRVAEAPFESIGLVNRLRNLHWARSQAGQVNHITGDINYIALALPRETVILTIHDLATLHRLSGIKRWLYKQIWFSLPIKRSRIITVISQATHDDVCREFGLDPARVVVIPDAVSSAFQPDPRPFNAACPRILQIAARRNKNVPRLLEALSGLPCHLHLIGKLDAATQQALTESGIAHTLEANLSEAQMVRAYQECDLVTLCSTSEGFGMPIIEAQWVERPIVTSNRSSMPEVAGAGACLVDPLDVADMRRGIQRVIADDEYRQELIERGRENRLRFQLEVVAQSYRQLYHDILGQNTSSHE